MGTYTTNYQLYMPSIGEQGWGELVNGNFSTIDTFLKPITISGSTYTFTGNHVGNQSGGTITATKITNSGTLTQTGTSTFTGKITANGGIGTKALSATSISNSGNMTNTGTLTSTGKIYANGGIEGVTTLDKVVNVSAASTYVDYCRHAVVNILPYIPGVLYTGVVACCTANSNSGAKLYALSSSDEWAAYTVPRTNTPSAVNISNVKCVIGYSGTNDFAFGFSLPIFT